jgi:hypothetical protein
MKTAIYRMMIFLLFLVSVGPRLTYAQPGFAVDFKASSSFSAGNATFPAGSYTARQQQDDLGIVAISSADGQHTAFVACEPLDATSPVTKTELTFHKYGDSLFLKQIWISGNPSGLYLVGGPQEKQARKTGKPTKVSVPATAK